MAGLRLINSITPTYMTTNDEWQNTLVFKGSWNQQYVSMCVCVWQSPCQGGWQGTRQPHLESVIIILQRSFVHVWYNMQHSTKHYSYIMHWNVLMLPVYGFLLLVVRGVHGLILAQSQVSAPLNSWPVTGYRRDRATPMQSPAQSGGYMQCVGRGLTAGITRGVTSGFTCGVAHWLYYPLTVYLWVNSYQNTGMDSFSSESSMLP